jgi:8-oxo-dGTP diphosphatase
METSIYKVGAIILRDKDILVVRKRTADNRSEYIIPGGRAEAGETDEDTLRRELMEELGVVVNSFELFGSYDDMAVFESVKIHMEVYLVDISGDIQPHNEIKEYEWINACYADKGIQLGTVLANHVIPKLVSLDHM